VPMKPAPPVTSVLTGPTITRQLRFGRRATHVTSRAWSPLR
jgi:hypothetical protein